MSRVLHSGFVFLLSVLVIGFIFVATSMTLILLGRSASLTSVTTEKTQQALELANTCADVALLGFSNTNDYVGDQLLGFAYGDCKIYPVSSLGISRTVCVEGTASNAVRRLQLTFSLPPGVPVGSSSSAKSAPPPSIGEWDEVECCTIVSGSGGCSSSS